MALSVDVVIPVRNDEIGLRRCLESLRSASSCADAEVRVFVADNGSEDDSLRVAQDLADVAVELPGLRVSELRNRVVAMGQGEWVAFVDADHEVSSDWFVAAAELMTSDGVSALGAPCWPPEPATWVQEIYNGLRSHVDSVEEVEWLGAGNMVVRRSVFEQQGGFDASLETCEDVDLCLRIRRDEGVILHVPGMRSIHFGDPRSLANLYKSELWRGRDNLRVSFRHGVGLRDIPSVGFPMLLLVAMLCAPLAAIAVPWIGWVPVIAISALALVVFSARALVVWLRVGSLTVSAFIRSAAVAVTYEVARAASLILRVAHRRA